VPLSTPGLQEDGITQGIGLPLSGLRTEGACERKPLERRLKLVRFRFFSGSFGFVRGMSRARDDHCRP
jgi:hypothetical protein